MDSITKICSNCKIEKPLSNFTDAPKRAGGKHSICKSCKREYDKEYRNKNKEKIARYHSEYWNKNKETITKRFLCWYKQNTEKVKATSKKWLFKNIDRVEKYQKEWRIQNKEHLQEWQKKYNEENREELNRKHLPITHKRRARIAGNGGNYTAKQWKLVCDFYGNKCLRCGATDKKMTVDHVLPTLLGGTSNIDNLQPLCLSCNCSKHAAHIDYRFDKGEFAKGLNE
jgi:hypothetical protein